MLPVMCYVSLKWTALQTELICIKQHTLIKKKKNNGTQNVSTDDSGL